MRDHLGNFVSAFSVRIETCSITEVDPWLRQQGFQRIIMESDSLNVIGFSIVNCIKQLASLGEGNQVADKLAKDNFTMSIPQQIFHVVFKVLWFLPPYKKKSRY